MARCNVQYSRSDTRVKITRTPQALILIFALTAMLLATALHPTRPAIQNACHAAYYLEDIAANAQALIRRAIDSAEKATAKATKFLAVAAETGPKALAANLIAILLLKSAGEVLNSVQTNAAVINAGTTAAAQLAGQMLTVAEISNTEIETTNFVTAARAYSDSTNLQAKPKLAPAQNGTCKASATEREGHGGDPEPPTPGQNKIVLIGIKTRTMPAKAANAELTLCGSTAHSNNDPYDSSHQCTSAQGTVLALKGGKIYETVKITITRKEGGAENKYTESAEATAIPNKKTVAEATTAIAALEEAASAIAAVSAPLDIKPLITAPRLK
uniref:Variant surface glycoprotein 1125.1479 n=1 Tax=Trypanosoma brucei TaxID=5691 RepID=A0A1J0R7A3_9TRYP|nr:variant surface glycoprotein 1125.1479 [Trypanosoma brucei]